MLRETFSALRARFFSGKSESEIRLGNQLWAQEIAQTQGTLPISQVKQRERVKLAGTVQSVTFSAPDATLSLRATLYDGSASLVLCWLGRQEIPGIRPGAQLLVTGMVTTLDGSYAIINPSYDILLFEG
ncbi:OB-fold nucleic acid binding domain-containing protein [Actinomycetaceae bacterium TAE3-ERU4]|nr:OB-fold nucleic acid binding domain-containing protein [Actinomycetaceae bacterium TAE3-ERU4]